MTFAFWHIAAAFRSTGADWRRGMQMLAIALAGLAAATNVSAGSFTDAAPMQGHYRYGGSTTLLPNGLVLVAAGVSDVPDTSQLYNPATDTWSLPNTHLAHARYWHTGTLLLNGKVLVAGGRDTNSPNTEIPEAELYDPATDTWSLAGSLATARYNATATLLTDGKVLVAGGQHVVNNNDVCLNDAELYDPATNTWSAAGIFTTNRTLATATLLPNGKVLLASGADCSNDSLVTADLYDPATKSWTPTSPLTQGRYNAAATLLSTGKVLVAGGFAFNGASVFLSSAELYDPVAGTWSAAGSMASGRDEFSMAMLPSGQVLVAGGIASGGTVLPNAELYDPTSDTWSATGSLTAARYATMATLLSDGRLLLVGGIDDQSLASGTAQIYDPTAPAWTTGGSFILGRDRSTATLLPTGKVLLAGGQYQVGPDPLVNRVDLYDPAGDVWSQAASLTTARASATATLLPNGKVLVAGGQGNNGNGFPVNLASAERYDAINDVWMATASMSAQRSGATATLLPNGKVLVAGGQGTGLATAEVYDPAIDSWSPAGSMAAGRSSATATLLPSGKVLVAGGGGNPGVIASTELYDPSSNTWSSAGNLATARFWATATLLPNGNVLVAGGISSAGVSLDSAELYDPTTNAWSTAPAPGMARHLGVAALLPNGNVLISGGAQTAGNIPIANTSLYSPANNTWLPSPSLAAARFSPISTLLLDGRVLVAGGYGTSGFFLTSSELFDLGLGFSSARRPVVIAATDPLHFGGSLALTGTGFRGDSEASSGFTGNAPTNYPLVQLRRIDNEQLSWISPATAISFSATAWTSTGASGLQQGPHLVTMFVNGIPGLSRLINVTPATAPLLQSAKSRKAHGGSGTFDLTLSP